MILIILQDMKKRQAKVAAIISLEGQQIRVGSTSQFLSKLIETLLPMPTKIKIRDGNSVTKRAPKNAAENLTESIKQRLYYPYRIASSEDVIEKGFLPRYKKVYPTNILYGESRHESDRQVKQQTEWV